MAAEIKQASIMAALNIEYPDELVTASGKSRQVIEQELKFQLAVRLFQVGRLSMGKAAEVAGMNKLLFMDELWRLQMPVVNWDDAELAAEVRAICGDAGREQRTRF